MVFIHGTGPLWHPSQYTGLAVFLAGSRLIGFGVPIIGSEEHMKGIAYQNHGFCFVVLMPVC